MPITWRNVDAPSMGVGMQGMSLANSTFNSAFDKFNDVIKQQQAVDEGNWQNQKTNNTQAFLNEVGKYRTPEEYAAAQQSGALDAMRTGFGAQIDQAAARSAQDGRESTLQNRALAGIGYKNAVDDAADAPLKDQAMAKLLAGDVQGAKDITEHLNHKAATMQAIDARGQEVINRDRAKEQFGFARNADTRAGNEDARKEAAAPVDLLVKRAQAAYQTSLANKADAETELAGKTEKDGSKAATAALEQLVKGSVLSAGVIGTKEGDESVMKWINDNLHGAQKEDAIYNFNKRKADGYTVSTDAKGNALAKPFKAPIPAQVYIDSLGASTENPLAMITPGWSRRGDDADNILMQRMKDPALHNEVAGIQAAQGNLMFPGLLAQSQRAEAKRTLLNATNPSNDVADGADPRDSLDNAPIRFLNKPQIEAARKKAMEKNSKLPDDVKKRIGIAGN